MASETIIDDAADTFFHEKFLALALVYGPLKHADLAYAELESFAAAFEKVFDVDLHLDTPAPTKEGRYKHVETALDWMDRYARWYKSQETLAVAAERSIGENQKAEHAA